MIISRTPFRISLFGGSTDYKEFYETNSTILIGFAIDKYIYITARHTPTIMPYHTSFKYAKSEQVDHNLKLKHDGARGVFEFLNNNDAIEINDLMDIPARTGLGSSSAFVIGLLNALYALYNKQITKRKLANEAIYIERDLLKEPGGIQDQIWASYGGVNSIEMDKDGYKVKPLPVSQEFLEDLRQHSLIFYTGNQRNSFDIAQHSKKSHNIKEQIVQIAFEAYSCFQKEDIDKIGKLLDTSWQLKKEVSQNISNPYIDKIYNSLKYNGAIGCKLLGSGGSGFIYCIVKDKERVSKNINLETLDYHYDYQGSKIIYQNT